MLTILDPLYNNKRIVIFAAETVPSAAGSGINAFRFACFLAKGTYKVKIVCFNYNLKLPQSEIREKVHIRRIPYLNSSLFTKILSLPLLLFNYSKAAAKADISFIFGAYMPGFEMVILVNLLMGKKTVYQSTLLNDDDIWGILTRKPKFLKPFRRALFRKVSLYHAINEDFKNSWHKAFGSNAKILMHSQGIDTSLFRPMIRLKREMFREQFALPSNSFIILSTGILIERKGYLEIFNSLKKINFPFIYCIAGLDRADKYHRSSVIEKLEMNKIKQKGIELLGEKIRFMGQVEQIESLYACADLYLHGATQEGTPGAVLEAMGCGLPILVRKLKGMHSVLINNITAMVFETNKEMVSKLLQLYEDKALRNILGVNAAQIISDEHSFQDLSEKLFSQLNA